MTATKKSIRFLTVLALVFAMVLSIASTPVSAAGVETWYAPTVTEPVMDVGGYNLTPIKTMGVKGVLYIQAEYMVTTPGIVYPDKPKFVLEIRSTDGKVLARDSYTGICIVGVTLKTRTYVDKGQKVQIYTSVYDEQTGVWYDADVQYKHWIEPALDF